MISNSDFSHLEGTECYCSPESAENIRASIAALPLDGVHLLGTGDYHYISLFWLERIEEDFTLALFDNHPDDQPDAFGAGMLSCGNWVAEAGKLRHCKGIVRNIIPESSLPVYISVDLDVLSEEYAHTDWDQGDMSLDDLTGMIRKIKGSRRVIGADICGGLAPSKGGTKEDEKLNRATMEAVIGSLNIF